MKINKKILIVGVGNMGAAMLKGLISNDLFENSNIFIFDKSAEKTAQFNDLDLNIVQDINRSISEMDIVVVAIKPQDITEFLSDIKDNISEKALIISIAAGIKISKYQDYLGDGQAVVRVMPNLCVSVNKSISAWVGRNIDSDQKTDVSNILNTIGQSVELSEEEDLNAVTAISGSGPAYYFYISELLENAAIKLGLSSEISRILVEQTLIGSAEVIKNQDISFKNLKDAVTSKGGTTEAALNHFMKNNFDEIFLKGVTEARKRSIEISEQF